MSKRKLEIQTRSSNQTCIPQPRAWKYFTSFHVTLCIVNVHTTHTPTCARVPALLAGCGNTGQFSSSLSRSFPHPCSPCGGTKRLVTGYEKLKCDGFNYNLYFHLTINYLPLIGGTSLSYDTSSEKILSRGEEQLGELKWAVSLLGTWGAGEGVGGH